jgi:hypothetical protein
MCTPHGAWGQRQADRRPSQLDSGAQATVAGRRGMWLHAAMFRTAALSLVVAGCGASTHRTQVSIAPPPAPTTVATLAGPLCDGDHCACRNRDAPADGGAGAPDAGVKRFEIRVGPSEHPLWVTVDDMVLYKSEARAEDCFYVDLGAGDHHFSLQASHPGGVSAAVTMSEYAPEQASWYDSYQFECGSPGQCSLDELTEYRASLAKYPRDIHDPCGSVKVKGLSWDTSVPPDAVHPDDLAVAWSFDIYDFAPKHPHGDPACADRL